MGYIEKGKITSINGNVARVVPCSEAGLVSEQIVIPWHLRGQAGDLAKGTEVIYCIFDDQTGILLCRADGEWGSILPALSVSGAVSCGSLASQGNISGANISGAAFTASGNISGANISGSGISVSGSISAASVSCSGQVSGSDVSAGGVSLKGHKHSVAEGATETGLPS